MSFLRVQACPSNDHAITNRVFVADADYQKLRRASDEARARRAEPRAQGLVAFAAAARRGGLAPRLRARVLGFVARAPSADPADGAEPPDAVLVRLGGVYTFFAAADEQVSAGAVALNRIQRWLAALEIDAPARVEPDDADVGVARAEEIGLRIDTFYVAARAEPGADRLALAAQFALAFDGQVFVVGQRVAMRVKNGLMVLCVQRLWTATAAGDGARGRLSRRSTTVAVSPRGGQVVVRSAACRARRTGRASAG